MLPILGSHGMSYLSADEPKLLPEGTTIFSRFHNFCWFLLIIPVKQGKTQPLGYSMATPYRILQHTSHAAKFVSL